MWIKTPEGNLLNLETGFEIGKVNTKVIFTYPQLDMSRAYLEKIDGDYEIDFNGSFLYKEIAVFDNVTDAWKYIDKLAQKLGAEEI